MKSPTSIHINLDALDRNLQRLQQQAPHCHIMAMIKANAYGHGITACARALAAADAFGVARTQEVLALREAGIDKRIVLMQGITFQEDLSTLVDLDCELVLHNHQQLAWLLNPPTTCHKKIKIWLKVNTGLNRLGFSLTESEAIGQQLANCPHIEQPVNLMSHIAWTKTAEHSSIDEQQQLFQQLSSHFSGEKSLSKSGLILANNIENDDWIRPGILLYGISPFEHTHGNEFGFEPVMSFRSTLIAIRQQKKGDSIAYDASGRCEEDMPVGIVAVGYGDGYPGQAPNGTPILIGGHICPTLGRVAMDMLHVDLRAYPQAKVGDEVTLWGEGLAVEAVARHVNVSPYVLVTTVNHRQLSIDYQTLSS